MEARQAAEREKIAAEAEAEKLKINAAAEAERLKVSADAEAYSIKTKAEAEAAANKLVAESVTDDLIDYTKAQSWNGQLPSTFVGSDDALPIINTDQTPQLEWVP